MHCIALTNTNLDKDIHSTRCDGEDYGIIEHCKEIMGVIENQNEQCNAQLMNQNKQPHHLLTPSEFFKLGTKATFFDKKGQPGSIDKSVANRASVMP